MNNKPATTTFLVLAGGVGKRFAPISVNKTLVPLFGKPILQHTLEQIERIGGKRVVVIANDDNQAWLRSFVSRLDLTIINQSAAGGMAEAVLLAQSAISTHPTLILNATDIVSDNLFDSLFQMTATAQTLIVGQHRDEYFNGGYLQIKGDRIISIVEKPSEGNQPSNYIKLVFDYFANPDRFIELLRQTTSQSDDHYELALAKLLTEEVVRFVPYSEYWQALKQPHMLLDLLQVMLTHQLHPIKPAVAVSKLGALISDRAVIEGPVQFGTGVRIEAGAVIKGPTYLGDNVIIGTHALVRDSSVEAGSVIGFGSEIARSYIGPNCKLHHNFIGDSVLESHINPSWGTTCTNWRLDGKPPLIHYPYGTVHYPQPKFGSILGKDTFCGANCTLMPGTTTTSHTRIYPNMQVKGALSGVITRSNVVP